VFHVEVQTKKTIVIAIIILEIKKNLTLEMPMKIKIAIVIAIFNCRSQIKLYIRSSSENKTIVIAIFDPGSHTSYF
jgi:hypothetical protein